MIRQASTDDIPTIVEIHSTALPGDFLPRLGKRFLNNVFYPGVLNSKHALVIVQEDLGIVRSFIVFAYDSRNLTKEASGNRVALAAYVVSALIRDLSLVGELLAHLRGFRTEMSIELQESLREIPELYVMASAPEYQSQGVGGELLEKGLEILCGEQATCVVKTSSKQAQKFYERHDFKEIGFEHRGARQIRLLLRS